MVTTLWRKASSATAATRTIARTRAAIRAIRRATTNSGASSRETPRAAPRQDPVAIATVPRCRARGRCSVNRRPTATPRPSANIL